MKASNCYDGGWMLFSHQSLKTLGLPVTFPDFGDASPKNTNWAGAPTSDYRKLQKKFFLTK